MPIYLALFGGNADGSEWWGNHFIEEPENKFYGDFERALKDAMITKRGLQAIEQALDERLSEVLNNKIVDKFENKIKVVGNNKIEIDIGAIVNQSKRIYRFTYNY